MIEPGRSIVAATGVLLCKVEYRKEEKTDNDWLIIDTGMNDLMRPAMYDASHRIVSVLSGDNGAATETYTIAGPICESADIMARDVRLSVKAAMYWQLWMPAPTVRSWHQTTTPARAPQKCWRLAAKQRSSVAAKPLMTYWHRSGK